MHGNLGHSGPLPQRQVGLENLTVDLRRWPDLRVWLLGPQLDAVQPPRLIHQVGEEEGEFSNEGMVRQEQSARHDIVYPTRGILYRLKIEDFYSARPERACPSLTFRIYHDIRRRRPAHRRSSSFAACAKKRAHEHFPHKIIAHYAAELYAIIYIHKHQECSHLNALLHQAEVLGSEKKLFYKHRRFLSHFNYRRKWSFPPENGKGVAFLAKLVRGAAVTPRKYSCVHSPINHNSRHSEVMKRFKISD